MNDDLFLLLSHLSYLITIISLISLLQYLYYCDSSNHLPYSHIATINIQLLCVYSSSDIRVRCASKKHQNVSKKLHSRDLPDCKTDTYRWSQSLLGLGIYNLSICTLCVVTTVHIILWWPLFRCQ